MTPDAPDTARWVRSALICAALCGPLEIVLAWLLLRWLT